MVKPRPPPDPDLMPLPGRRRSIAKGSGSRVPARLCGKSKNHAPTGLPLSVLGSKRRRAGGRAIAAACATAGDAGASGPAEGPAEGPVEGLQVVPHLADPLSNHGIEPQPAAYVDEDGMSDSKKPGFYATVDSGATYKWHRKLEDVRDWLTAAGHKVSKSKLDNINVQIEASGGRATNRANANRVIHMQIAPLPSGVWFMSKAEFQGRGLRSTVTKYDDLPVVYDADVEDNDISEITSEEMDELTGEMQTFCVYIARATVLDANDAQGRKAGAVHAEAVRALPLPPPVPPPRSP